MTDISDLYPFMRTVLGDSQVMDEWCYSDADLLGAVRAVMAFGEGPDGYEVVGSIFEADQITPALATGDDLALVVYAACHKLVVGEDGKISYRTRSLAVTDGGERKRDLLAELELCIARIREGGRVFLTWQSVSQFLGSDQSLADFAKATVTTPVTDIDL